VVPPSAAINAAPNEPGRPIALDSGASLPVCAGAASQVRWKSETGVGSQQS
jgi:hypothetical protein